MNIRPLYDRIVVKRLEYAGRKDRKRLFIPTRRKKSRRKAKSLP